MASLDVVISSGGEQVMYFAGRLARTAVERYSHLMNGSGKTGYVYFMSNRSRMLYIGVTSDLGKRVGQHKFGFYPGYTKKYKMNQLVYVETFPEMTSALARETQLKNWSRAKKVALLTKNNPEWLDLASTA